MQQAIPPAFWIWAHRRWSCRWWRQNPRPRPRVGPALPAGERPIRIKTKPNRNPGLTLKIPVPRAPGRNRQIRCRQRLWRLAGAAASVMRETDEGTEPELEAPADVQPALDATPLAEPAAEVEKDMAAEPEKEAAAESEADLTGEQEFQLFPEPEPEPAAVPEPELFGEPEPETEPERQPEPESPPGPQGSLDLRVAGARAAFNPPTPLPMGRGPDRSIPGAPVVAGSLCARGHLNRPGIRNCIRCSAPVPPAGSSTVSGTRPALGVLILDDGSVYRLERGYLVGSRPEGDPTVRGGLALPLTLSGEDVSAAHAEVRLHDWDVMVTDRGSATGTCVFEPGGADWEHLRAYEPRTLVPGTHLAFGQRIATFVTPWILAGDDANHDT